MVGSAGVTFAVTVLLEPQPTLVGRPKMGDGALTQKVFPQPHTSVRSMICWFLKWWHIVACVASALSAQLHIHLEEVRRCGNW